MWIGSLGLRMFWGTRATNFSIYTTKMEGAGPQILGAGAKFKQVPCQQNCRVNRAHVLPNANRMQLSEMRKCDWQKTAVILNRKKQSLQTQ